MTKLNQILAIEKRIKQQSTTNLTTLHRESGQVAHFGGFQKTYQALEDDAETFPDESKVVSRRAPENLRELERTLSEIFDITLTKDKANQSAKADIVVDDVTLVKDVPATTLIFIDKKLQNINTMINDLPVLPPEYIWNMDESSGLFKTAAIKTHKTKKVQRPIVLYQATEKHPAQTQLISEDVTIGHWSTVRESGALAVGRKQELLERVEKLIKAVKFAREKANATEAPNLSLGREIFKYLLS